MSRFHYAQDAGNSRVISEVDVRRVSGEVRIEIDGAAIDIHDVEAVGDGMIRFWIGKRRYRARVVRDGETRTVFVAGGIHGIRSVVPTATDTAAEGDLNSPMPGKVIEIAVDVGQQVAEGDTLAVIEAMKMEYIIRAPHSGVVERVLCVAGDQVEMGQELFRMEESSTASEDEDPS